MSCCPWCGDRSQSHSKTACFSNPYRNQILSQQSSFSAAIGLQAVSGIPNNNSVRVYCRAYGCTSCTNPGQTHYCHVCGNRDSTHCAKDCHLNAPPVFVVQSSPHIRFAPSNVSPHGNIGFFFN